MSECQVKAGYPLIPKWIKGTTLFSSGFLFLFLICFKGQVRSTDVQDILTESIRNLSIDCRVMVSRYSYTCELTEHWNKN